MPMNIAPPLPVIDVQALDLRIKLCREELSALKKARQLAAAAAAAEEARRQREALAQAQRKGGPA
jgi:hypothetical protein